MKNDLNARHLSFGALALLCCSANAQRVRLHPVAEGAVKMIGYYRPERVQVADGTGKANKIPRDLKSPSFGEIKIQNKSFGVIVDRPDEGDYKLYVDSNGDGDFTNDPAVNWVKKGQVYKPGTPAHIYYLGFAKVKLVLARKPVLASIGVYMFDKNDSQRAALKNQLLFYADFAEKGTVRFGKSKVDFLLSDATGMVSKTADAKNVELLFDRHDNGRFGTRENVYPLDKPFNLGGKAHEVKRVSFEKGTISFGKSKTLVAEIPFPVRLLRGDQVVTFKAKTTSGDPIEFPSSYKGKVVLLDFWATWCGPCMAEVPNVVAAYNKFHGKGFDILGISLDNADTMKQIPKVTQEKQMSWPQVCDGKFWAAAVAKLYNVQAIPQAYLVDGATGKIIAQGDELRGEGLEKALAAHFPDSVHQK